MRQQRNSTRSSTKRTVARVLVRPPTRPSDGAQFIKTSLAGNALLSRQNPVRRQFRTVINWGNPSALQHGEDVVVLNKPEAINKAINKLTALQTLQEGGTRVPEFTTKLDKAEAGTIWFARTVLDGSCGRGISVIREGDGVPAAPLYVRYIRKDSEYRVHVAFGQPIFAQLKLRQREAEQTNDQKLIRNHDNGWVFGPRPLEEIPDDVKQQAVKAVESLGLDFGAVDLVVGKKDKLAYVLEVNTAPGIESPGLKQAYAKTFTERLGHGSMD